MAEWGFELSALSIQVLGFPPLLCETIIRVSTFSLNLNVIFSQ